MSLFPSRDVGLSLLLALSLSGCSAPTDDTPPPPVSVKLMTVAGLETGGTRDFVGRVTAASTVDLTFQVPGRIRTLTVQEGTVIPRGGLLAALDDRDTVLAVREAQAQLTQAERNQTRGQELFRREVISRAELETLETQRDLARVQLDQARQQLAYTRLTVPFDALVTQRLAEPQALVSPQQPVLRVQDVSSLRVEISVPEQLVGYLADPSQLTATAQWDELSTPQPLTYVEHQTQPDPVAQTYPVRFQLPRGTDAALTLGRTVSVSVALAAAPQQKPRITVPPSALDLRDTRQARVWIFDAKDQVVRPRRVTLGPIRSDAVEVRTGLTGGEQVVVAGAQRLQDGQAARPFTGL